MFHQRVCYEEETTYAKKMAPLLALGPFWRYTLGARSAEARNGEVADGPEVIPTNDAFYAGSEVYVAKVFPHDHLRGRSAEGQSATTDCVLFRRPSHCRRRD